jgi:hypothetical protein
MAAKTPDSVQTHSLGNLKLTIATFITNDIDDNDTWASGIKSVVGHWWGGIADNAYDVQVTSITDGEFLFDSAANMTGRLYVLSYDY